MCLQLNPFEKPENSIKTAAENIVCWKVVRDEGSERYSSLYYNYAYAVGELNHIDEMGAETEYYPKVGENIVTVMPICKIHRAFHSYKYVECSMNEMTRFNSVDNVANMVVVKCIIPKGSKYYENDAFYASDSIVVIGVASIKDIW